jgi:hypothetical protein
VAEGDHDGHTVVAEPQQVEALGLRAEVAGADVLNRANPVVGVNYLVADVEGRAGTHDYTFCELLN